MCEPHLDLLTLTTRLFEVLGFSEGSGNVSGVLPYSITKKATRDPNSRPVWHSNTYAEDNTWIRIGNEAYYLSANGKLMPSRKGQAPPDLQYFKQLQK